MKKILSRISDNVQRKPRKTAPPADEKIKPFPVVGIGASAGGVQAIIALLNKLDPNLGMAYVVVMHLSPHHESALAKIVQAKTKMTVATIKDGMKIKPNCVYVIPPGKLMKLVNGHLELAPRKFATSRNFAIDYFLTALASDYKNNAIGIILSGTATDGTLGLKAIKAEGGITFAQDETAEFHGMPQHAYDAGYVDFLLPPDGIAKELSRLMHVPYTKLPSGLEKDELSPVDDHTQDLKSILAIVRNQSGIDFFHHYKHASIYRRVMRRMVLNKVHQLKEYHSLLQTNSKEVEALYDDFLINVTSFFRDPDFYKILTSQVFPSIIRDLRDDDPIRVWVAGCSTGEEAYSIAISLMEYLDDSSLLRPIQIFASDLDSNAIEKARLGVYNASALQDVSKNRLRKFFTKAGDHYQIIKPVREVCVFSRQNLLKDPPFSKMHLISCQNVLIYLETVPQKKLLHTFHYALKPTGFLFLGKSETIGSEEDLFEPLDKRIRLYSRKATTSPQLDFTIHKSVVSTIKQSHAERITNGDPENALTKLLLSRFVYPSVVVNKNLMITQFFGATSQYLEPVAGKASFNILKMIREELVVDLGSLLQIARKTEKTVRKEGIAIVHDRTKKEVTIEVIPKIVGADIYFLVIFKEREVYVQKGVGTRSSTNGFDRKDKIIEKLEDDLARSRGLIRSTNEEYETTYEELQANNEEVLSSNEELQSVNEELETSKEELQSAVEELTTTNDELRRRNIELSESQQDLKQVNEQLEQFAFISSHDLQEPLRKILMFSDLLSRNDANLNTFSKKYTAKINASAFRMSSLLKDLLSYSVLINKNQNFSVVDLNDTVIHAVGDFEASIKTKKAVVNLTPLPSIQAEPIQMHQLFHNLISNALNYCTALPVISITSSDVSPEDRTQYTELNPETRYVAIRVRDNGIGFDERHVDKMFSLFQRLNSQIGVEGTGMGLAICKKIVKNHHGFIFANGKIYEGATFTIFLPVEQRLYAAPLDVLLPV